MNCKMMYCLLPEIIQNEKCKNLFVACMTKILSCTQELKKKH